MATTKGAASPLKAAASVKRARSPRKPTLLLLVRHGRTATTGSVLPGRTPGLHLAPVGVDQARHVAGRIAALAPSAVYTSPLERTRETAAAIAGAAGLRTRTARGLIECDFGDWTGRSLSSLRRNRQWDTVQRSPSTFRFPAGESFAEMSQRMWDQLLVLAADHSGDTIVAVSHADPIKAAIAMALGSHLDGFQRIVVSPCSVTALLFGEGTPIVLGVNNTGDDLTALAPS